MNNEKSKFLKIYWWAGIFCVLAGIVASIVSLSMVRPIVQQVVTPTEIIRETISHMYEDIPEDILGATIPVTVAVFESSLQATINVSSTSMTLNSGTTKSGDNLSGYICFTLNEGTSNEEYTCGTASGTSVTSLVRGIDPVDGDLAVEALIKTHRRGASVKITNYPQLAIVSRILNGDETIPNLLTYAATTTPVNQTDIVHKYYVDTVAIAGASNATTSLQGLVEMATNAELVAGTEKGSTGANLCANTADFGNTSSAKQMVAVTDADGDIPGEFMELDFAYAWSGNSTFAGMSTFNATTNLTSIFQLNSVNVSTTAALLNEATDLFEGSDITATEAEDLTDSGTSTIHSHPMAVTQTTRTNAAGTGDQTIAHGLGVAPNLIVVNAVCIETAADLDTEQSRGHATGTGDDECQKWSARPTGSGIAGQIDDALICGGNGVANLSTTDATNITINWSSAVPSDCGTAYIQIETWY